MTARNNDDPFSNWPDLIDKAVYSIDGKCLGFLRKIHLDYMVVGGGIISLKKYFIPKSLAESVSRKGIRLTITAYEVRSKYSYAKMKSLVTIFKFMPEYAVEHRAFYDRVQTLRYYVTRNRLAAGIAFVSGVLLLLSGYKATFEIYSLITQEIILHTSQQFWIFLLVPFRILAVLSQLGGVTVLIGAALFAANRVNIAKFSLSIGTGQGLFTIAFHIVSDIASSSSGRLTFGNHYVIWLTSSMAGIGILFAVMAQSISKGKGDSIISKVLGFLGLRKLLLILKKKM
ncbi:MAG: hypothetical protein JO297_00030 [Nitrososphaeraceae archaeon]|nr:hypothetical protein [Nitrososphaeraceae archaeon]